MRLGPARAGGLVLLVALAMASFAEPATASPDRTAETPDGRMPERERAGPTSPGSGITSTVPLEVRAPAIDVELDFADLSAPPGGVLTFALAVTNRGPEPARHVWVNESLHPALTYLSDTAPIPPAVEVGQPSWHFVDFAPGTTRFGVTVQIDPRAVEGTVVTSFLSVDYTDARGDGLARGRSDTVWFRVARPEEPANGWFWGSFGISSTIVGGTYLGFARRRLRIEEIFLIHRSGVLLVHMSKSLKSDLDTDILTGMFTAIMNFVRDAFHYEARQELQGLDLGEYRVHVRKGDIAYLALVHRGKATRWMSRTAARAVHEIESEWGEMLREWDGEVRALRGVREILKGHFLSPTGPSRPSQWLRGFLARADQTFKPVRPL